ncbi:MAG: hypothetical protein FWF01_04040 [Alphaproteobacteria bacterium]|nr:hypothetical protein [Alphaproteobacteria bacterium]
MKAHILQAVANPPKMIWAPFVPGIFNILMTMFFTMFGVVMFQMNPLIGIVSLPFTHSIIIAIGKHEPHLSNMLMSLGRTRGSKNPYRSRGAKFAP